MANLIQIAEELEYMPKDQLAQMTQDPNSTYPQFLVLSEIQRRTQLEKAYQAQATQAEPQTTVAEETVAEFMAPQGLQGMAQQPMPQDMPAPMPESPMQMMADGGRIGFMSGGNSPRSILLSTMGANPSGMTDQEMGGLITQMNQESEQLPAQRSFGLMEGEIVPEVVEEEEEMMAGGGRTGFFALGSTSGYNVQNSPSLADSETIDVASIPEETRAEIVEASKGLTPAQKAMIGINAASLALMVTPIPGARVNWSQAIKDGVITAATVATIAPSAGGAALGLAGRGIAGAFRGLRNPRAIGERMLERLGQFTLNKGLKPLTPKIATPLGPQSRFGSTTAIQAGKEAVKKVAPRIIGGGILASQALPEGSEEEDKPVTSPVVGPVVDDTDTIIDTDTGGTATKKGGPFSNITPDQGLTMAQLGGVLMGARNMSELGTGIAGVAGQMQERKSAAGLAGAQQAYYEGQVRKIDSEIADMPKEAIREQMSMLIEASEAGLITDINLANAQYAALAKRLAVLEGQEIQPASQDANVIASYG